MKKVINAIILTVSILNASPDWYLKSGEGVYGYGNHKDKTVATYKAYDEISRQLGALIVSKATIRENSNSSFASSTIDVYTKRRLSNVKIVKMFYDEKEEQYYIKATYDNSSSVSQLAKKILDSNTKTKVEPTYLNLTKFGKRLKKLIGFNIGLHITRIDGQYMIQTSNFLNVTLREDELSQLMFDSGANLTNKKIFKHHDKIFFYTNNDKYVTILSLEHSGKVGVVESNLKQKYYPTSGKIIINNDTSHKILENYFFIFSSKKINVLELSDINKKILGDDSFDIQLLVELLDTFKYDSTIIKIKGKL